MGDVYGPRRACWCLPHCGLPPCTECGEDHGGHDYGGGSHLCRECDITRQLDSMQCSACTRMRYRTDAPAQMTGFAQYLWGDRCTCDPKPPSVYEAREP